MNPSIPSIVIGADHAGFDLKTAVAEFLRLRGIVVRDVGCYSTDRVDYPDIVGEAVRVMRAEGQARAILVCGSGIGVAMAANRYPGIRAVTANDIPHAVWSRRHNDANVLCLGARLITPEQALEIVETWLETPFDGGRHVDRVKKMDELI